MVSFTGQTVAAFVEELAGTGLFQGLDPACILRSIPLLAHLPDKELARLAGEAAIHSHDPGATVCRQGEFDDHLFLILSGAVETSLITDKARRIALERLGPGAMFGRLSASSDGMNMASVVAAERLHLIALGPDAAQRLARGDPHVAHAMQQAHLARTIGPALRLVPLFADAGPQGISLLTRTGRLRVFSKGQTIFQKGAPGDSLYLVVSGVVKVFIGDRILAYLKSGAYFGEMALVKNEPRMASVAAVTDVEAFEIMKADFEAFLQSHGPAADAIRRIIREREEENRLLAQHPERIERLRFMEGLVGGRDILVIDLDRCIHCDRCIKACAQARGQARFERKGDFFGRYLIATACRQCQDPACMLCKRGAILRDKSGEIHIKDACVGCGFCAAQCPYGTIMLVEVQGGDRKARKKAAKCDLCRHLDYPPCVYNCPTGALRRVEPEAMFLKAKGRS